MALDPSKREKTGARKSTWFLSPLVIKTRAEACFIPYAKRNKLPLQMSWNSRGWILGTDLDIPIQAL